MCTCVRLKRGLFGTQIPTMSLLYEPRRDFQLCGILTSVDSDEFAQPPFNLRNPK